jgi:tetratricopeptide (TPR) repeat protein
MAVKREQVVQTAEKYVARGKIEPAIREYRKLLEENPNDINTLNRVGDLYARIQRIDEAVDFFNQIAEQYAGEGFFVKAIAIYKKIIKLDPTRLDVYENLAELYHRQGLVTEARTQYQVLADYYQKHENATSTIAIYQKMAELEPNNPTYHVKLAELYQQQKLIEKAMGEYRIIAELMIDHGHPQEAAQVYERALAIDSSNLAFITDAALKLKEAAGAAVAAHFLATAVERNPQAAQVSRLVGGPAAAAPSPVAGIGDFDPAAEYSRRDPRDSSAPRRAPLLPDDASQLTYHDDSRYDEAAADVSQPAGYGDRFGLADRQAAATSAEPLPDSSGPPDAEDEDFFPRSALVDDPSTTDTSRGLPIQSLASLRPSGGGGYGGPGPGYGAGSDAGHELDLDMEIELDLGADLLAGDDLGDLPATLDGMPGGAARPASRQGLDLLGRGSEPAFEIEEAADAAPEPEDEEEPPAVPPRPRAAPVAGSTGEYDDPDDVFVLDIEDDEEPASLVKPPPDMLQQPRRPSWAREEEAAAAPSAPPASTAPPVPPLPTSAQVPAFLDFTPGGAFEPLPAMSDLPDFGDIELDDPFAGFADAPPRSLLEGDVPPSATPGPLLPPLPDDFDLPAAAAPPHPFAHLHDTPAAGGPASDRAGHEDVAPAAPLGPPGAPGTPMSATAGGAAGVAATAAASGADEAGVAGARGRGPAGAGAAPRPLKLDRELLERTAAELIPQAVERYEDLVSEAEVLAKYGLEEKALERLRDAVRIKPRSFAAYLLLIQLHLERGRHARVLELANQVSRLAEETGDRDPWIKLRRRLLATGYRLDGERVAAAPEMPAGMETPQRLPRPRNLTSGVPIYHPDPLPPLPDADAAAMAGAADGVPAALEAAAPAAAESAAASFHAAGPAGLAGIGALGDSTPSAARPARKKSEGEVQQLLDGLVGRGGRGGKPVRKAPASGESPPPADVAPPAPSAPAATFSAPSAPAAPTPSATFAPVAPAAYSAPAAPAAPPGVGKSGLEAPRRDRFELDPLLPPDEPEEAAASPAAALPGAIFNPLEIGAMVESEEIDWDDDGTSQPGFGHPATGGVPQPFGDPTWFPQPSSGASGAGGAAGLPGSLGTLGRGATGASLPPPSPISRGASAPSAASAAGALSAPSSPSSDGAGAAKTSDSAASLDDTGMSWLDEADSGKEKGAARAASLFDEEEDFFDLAGELEQELSQDAAFQGENLLVQQEQSLEEIVEGFKRGVAEHLSPTDYDTHFNLGIAYREMGLLDEAIGEFQLSAKDARYLVQCCSMLGLCFLDKGLPELAVKWYSRGLEAESLSDEDTLGLLYDLGCSYMAMGDNAAAARTFVDLYGLNTNYRDVVAKIEQLGQAQGQPH